MHMSLMLLSPDPFPNFKGVVRQRQTTAKDLGGGAALVFILRSITVEPAIYTWGGEGSSVENEPSAQRPSKAN